jgi:thioredoxin-related protein
MKKIVALFMFFCSITGAFASDETFKLLDGSSISYEKNIASGDTMLFLWTSRCPYCVRELRGMNKNENACKYSKCFFVNLGETEASIKEAVKALQLNDNISKNIIVDKTASLADKFSVIGVPTFIFMHNGRVLERSYHFDEDTVKEIFKK